MTSRRGRRQRRTDGSASDSRQRGISSEAASAGTAAGRSHAARPRPTERRPAPSALRATRPARAAPPARARSLRELPFLILVALVLALLIKAFLVQAFFIPSGSMEQTLHASVTGCWSTSSSTASAPSTAARSSSSTATAPLRPRRDAGVRRRPTSCSGCVRGHPAALGLGAPGEKDFIKRVIGVAGDTIHCCDVQGRITVNGTPLTSRTSTRTARCRPASPRSRRSRAQGPAVGHGRPPRRLRRLPLQRDHPRDKVIGRAFVRVWPLSRLGFSRPQDVLARLLRGGRGHAPRSAGRCGARLRSRCSSWAGGGAGGGGTGPARPPARKVGSRCTPHLDAQPVEAAVGARRRVRVRAAPLYAMERGLQRAGFPHVAGVDEAGRGACAGPLVVAAVVLPEGRRGQVPGLADSKLLTPAAARRVYAEVVRRALAWHAVVIPPGVSRPPSGCTCATWRGCGGRVRRPRRSTPLRADRRLPRRRARRRPSLAVWKGDRIAACVAAASVVAKVTRDRHDGRAARAATRSTASSGTRATSRPSTPPRSTARTLPGAPLLLRQRRRGGAGGRHRAGEDDPDDSVGNNELRQVPAGVWPALTARS